MNRKKKCFFKKQKISLHYKYREKQDLQITSHYACDQNYREKQKLYVASQHASD